MTDATDLGIAWSGRRRPSYRSSIHGRPNSATDIGTRLTLLAAKSRARERAAAITAIDLLDLLAPAVWRCAGGILLFCEIAHRQSRVPMAPRR